MTGNLSPLRLSGVARLTTLLLLCWLCPSTPAPAHPLDSFAIDQYVDIRFSKERIDLLHRIEFSDIPTAAELPHVDKNADLLLSSDESEPYLKRLVQELLEELALTIDEAGLPLTYENGKLSLVTSPSPRLVGVSSYFAAMPDMGRRGLDFQFFLKHRPTLQGDRQIRLICRGKFALDAVWSSQPDQPVGMAPPYIGSATALVYGHVTRWKLLPSEVEQSPFVPEISPGTATLVVRPENPFMGLNERGFGADLPDVFPLEDTSLPPSTTAQRAASPAGRSESGSGTAASLETPESGRVSQETWADRSFRNLFTRRDKGLWFLLTASLLSLLYGAAHALEPGHGKTVVGAYLVGSRGTAFHAVVLALIVTFTHTFSVYILGLIALTNLERVRGTYLPILECGSWALIAIMGLWLFLKYYKEYSIGLLADPFYHSHGFGPGHSHAPHVHAHEHTHPRSHVEMEVHEHDGLPPHAHGHPHVHDESAGGLEEAIEPRPDDVSFWSLLTLGVTGGIVPCPGALFVMMIALNTGDAAVGLYLITVFSVGLALTLMGVGIAMVHSRGLADRFSPNSRIVQLLPVLTSVLILLVGAGFFVNGLIKYGIVRIQI
ncbi:MAG: hypothetical protein GHCLOJNM_02769 [bacterium]|nr:hypothetical protein [bacterium]